MNAPFHPSRSVSRANPGPTPPRGLGRTLFGWVLVIAALACTWWARLQPAEWSAGKVALAVVVLVAMSGGVAMAGGSNAHHS
jgi:hypothetical protein